MDNLQQKSHETLIKLLNNIGIIGAILAAIADIIFVIIFVVGINIQQQMTATIVFAVVNAVIGVLISVLLRYQGQKYAEIENEELIAKYQRKKAEESPKYINMTVWQSIKVFQDIIVKGACTAFSICGLIYISIEGSKNPIQILITLVTLVLFACFGLINLNNAYYRYYNVQVPYMELKIKERSLLECQSLKTEQCTEQLKNKSDI